MIKIGDEQTKYTVKLSSDFIPSNEIFLYLYKPLIGSSSYSLYMLLYAEAKNHSVNQEKIERLTSLSNASFTELLEKIQKLELLGLLNLYTVKDAEKEIVFVLNKPLSINNFLKNEALVNTLKEVIGEEQFKINTEYLKDSMFEYTNEWEPLKDNNSEKTVETIFNTQPIKNLLEISRTDISWWTDEIDKKIVHLMLVNDLDNINIAEKINRIIEVNGEFDIDKLTRVLEENTIEEDIVDRLRSELTQSIESKIEMFSTLDPKEFIKIRLNRTATADEKKFIKELSNVSKFPKEFINFLLDFSVIKNKGVISIPYLEKIVATIIEKEIDSIHSLVSWLKTAYAMSNNKVEQQEIDLDSLTNTETKIEEVDIEFEFK